MFIEREAKSVNKDCKMLVEGQNSLARLKFVNKTLFSSTVLFCFSDFSDDLAVEKEIVI